MSEHIPLSVPTLRGNEWKYIKECLDTEWVSSGGAYVDLFQKRIVDYTGARHAVAIVNGTSALQVALRLAGVEAGDEVIVPTLTFIAPVNAVSYLNAVPVFMDCDDYYNIDVEKTIRFIQEETIFRDGATYNKKTNRRIRAVIPVHVFGNAVDLEPLVPVCRARAIKIIEDATESLGTCYTVGSLKGKHTGTIGDMGCYSFNGNKIITAGGGGMLVTDSEEYASKADYLINQAKDDHIHYIHNEIGYNFRLSNIQAALGVAQLERLNEYIKIKEENYLVYKGEIYKIPGLNIADTPGYAQSNYWFYCLQVDEPVYGKGRESIMTFLGKHRIQIRPVWQLNHLQTPYMDNMRYFIEKAPVLAAATLNIPCSVTLRREDKEKVINLLQQHAGA